VRNAPGLVPTKQLFSLFLVVDHSVSKLTLDTPQILRYSLCFPVELSREVHGGTGSSSHPRA
jgi:hypothetical protein